MTIKDIARLSGYGISTVSRVLNNQPDVSEETRKNIMKVVEKYGFQPNSNARHLKKQTCSPVAVLVKGTQNMLFADILEKIQALMSEHKEEVQVCYLDEDENEILYAIQLCKVRNPKGIIFLGANLEFFEENFDKIKIPCVLLTNDARELHFDNLSSVTTDDCAGGYRVIEYLVENGHQNIGIVGGNLKRSQIGRKRYQGACRAFEKYGIEFDQERNYESCRFSMHEGYDATKRLLKRCPEITAIFAEGDVIAFGAIRAIRDLGKRVPEDISLVGYDGIPFSKYCVPRLTTIHQNSDQFAKIGVDLLLQRLHYSYAAAHEVIAFELVEGESVETRIKK